MRTPRIRSPAVGVVAIVVMGLAGTGCGDGEGRASAAEARRAAESGLSTARAGSTERVGTIRARLDGDERMAVLAGFDTPDVPLESFRMDPGTGQYSYGSYRGSVLGITFDFEVDDFERTVRLPGSASAAVMYLPEVDGEADLSAMYMLGEGRIDVELIEARRGADSEFAGSFEGSLLSMDRSERIHVAEGRFEVTGALYWEPEESGPEGSQ